MDRVSSARRRKAEACTSLARVRARRLAGRFARTGWSWLVVVLAGLVAGCGGDSRRAARPSTGPVTPRGAVAALHLFSVPVTLNLDDRPGPDGFALTLYASNGRQARGMEIQSGTLEILMFDGSPALGATSAPAARRVWKFSAAELNAFQARTALGVGYRLALRWEETPPSGNRITVLARHLPAKGPPITSGPSSITVVVK